jgi:hypothetical protein
MVGRIKAILTDPKNEFQRIDAEPMTVSGIMTGWVVPLAAIGPVAQLIGSLSMGITVLGVTYRPSPTLAIGTAVTTYVLALVGAYICALVIDALAPSFGGQKDQVKAMKTFAYGATAFYLAGIFAIIPALGILALVGLYSFYLLYVALPILMKSPAEKSIVYLIVVIVVAAVVMWVIGAVTAAVMAIFVPAASPVGALTFG